MWYCTTCTVHVICSGSSLQQGTCCIGCTFAGSYPVFGRLRMKQGWPRHQWSMERSGQAEVESHWAYLLLVLNPVVSSSSWDSDSESIKIGLEMVDRRGSRSSK